MSPKQDFDAVLTARLTAIQDKKDRLSGYNWSVSDKQKVILALMDKIQADTKVNGKYTSYTGRFIILTALRKYGSQAVNQFKSNTLLQACKDYSLDIKAILK